MCMEGGRLMWQITWHLWYFRALFDQLVPELLGDRCRFQVKANSLDRELIVTDGRGLGR